MASKFKDRAGSVKANNWTKALTAMGFTSWNRFEPGNNKNVISRVTKAVLLT